MTGACSHGDPAEAVRFAPGDFQHRYNAGEEPFGLVALGAPRDRREVEDVRECPACGEVFHHRRPQELRTEVDPDDPARRAECPECGTAARRIARPD